MAVLSEDDLRALLGTCASRSFEDVRDQAIIRLLADTGMRRGELLGIEVDDLDLDGAVALVTGKGNRGRACPFGRKTSLAVDRYLRVRRRLPHAVAERPLWLTRHGRLNVSATTTSSPQPQTPVPDHPQPGTADRRCQAKDHR